MSQRVLLLGVALLLLSASSALAVNCQCDYTLTKPNSTTVRATVSAACDSGAIRSTTLVLTRDGGHLTTASSSGPFVQTSVSDPAGLQEYCVNGRMIVSGASSFQLALCNDGEGLPFCKNL